MDPKIDREYGDQTPKVSHTRGIKSPPRKVEKVQRRAIRLLPSLL